MSRLNYETKCRSTMELVTNKHFYSVYDLNRCVSFYMRFASRYLCIYLSARKRKSHAQTSLQDRQLVRSIPRLSAPSRHLLGKISAMGTFFSTRHLCLQSKWPTIMEITDVSQRRMLPWHLFCPVGGRMVLRALAVYASNINAKNFVF